MMFRLAVISHQWPVHAFTENYVWYGVGNVLLRRNLKTLKEESIYTFETEIRIIWTSLNNADVCAITLYGTPQDLWYQQEGQEWVRGRFIPYVGDPLSLGIQITRLDHGWQLWLVNRRRTVDRVQRLLKDETLAARVCHYL